MPNASKPGPHTSSAGSLAIASATASPREPREVSGPAVPGFPQLTAEPEFIPVFRIRIWFPLVSVNGSVLTIDRMAGLKPTQDLAQSTEARRFSAIRSGFESGFQSNATPRAHRVPGDGRVSR